MPIDRTYFEEYNFLLTSLTGGLEENDFREYVLSLNSYAEGKKGLRELSDCRNVTERSVLKTIAIRRTAQLETPKPESLLAILINDNILHFGLARVYQTFAAPMRKKIEIFTDFDKALTWLCKQKGDLKKVQQKIDHLKNENA